jgi:hypothetical protein
MKSLLSALALTLIAQPAFAATRTVPEPEGIGIVAGALIALIAVRGLRRK